MNIEKIEMYHNRLREMKNEFALHRQNLRSKMIITHYLASKGIIREYRGRFTFETYGAKAEINIPAFDKDQPDDSIEVVIKSSLTNTHHYCDSIQELIQAAINYTKLTGEIEKQIQRS